MAFVKFPIPPLTVTVAVKDILALRAGLQRMLGSVSLVAGRAEARKVALADLHGVVETETVEYPWSAVILIASKCFLRDVVSRAFRKLAVTNGTTQVVYLNHTFDLFLALDDMSENIPSSGARLLLRDSSSYRCS